MKQTYRIIGCLVALLSLCLVAGLAAADSETVTVNPSSSQAVSLGSMNEDDLLTLSWTSNTAVSAVLTGPSGYSETYSSTSYGFDIITIPHSGSYTLTFSNPSSSTTATVNLEFDVAPFNPIGTAHDIMDTILLVGVIIVVAIIAIVVVVLVMGSRKKAAAVQQPSVVVATTPGICPTCGAQTDTNAQFCAKCGAKFR